MNRIEAKNFLLKEFISNYGETTPVAYTNNENFEKPSNEPWVRFSVDNVDSDQATMGDEGNRRFERYGRITSQVFVPPNTGTYDGEVICNTIINIFEGKRFGKIVCKTGIYKELNIAEDESFKFFIYIPYELDETK